MKGAAEVGKQPQHGEVRIGLHGVAQLHVEPGEAGGQPAVIVRDRLRAVDVGRRAMQLRHRGEID